MEYRFLVLVDSTKKFWAELATDSAKVRIRKHITYDILIIKVKVYFYFLWFKAKITFNIIGLYQ